MSDSQSRPPLSERAQHVLRALVEQYIHDGQPVGSRTLARISGMGLSAATIRNAMFDLEEMGLLKSPHTSAGRVPTERGYRVFVDSLIQVQPIDKVDLDPLRESLDPSLSLKDLVETVSSFLSAVTEMAGVVTLPRRDHPRLRQVEFLPLSESRVLAILVIDEHEVQNRIVYTDRPYTSSELEQASNFFNAHFRGAELSKVRDELKRELERVRQDMNRMMRVVIEMAGKAFNESSDEDMVIAGHINLMNFAELSNVDKLKALFEVFNTKRDLLHLFERCLTAEGIQIFIGNESGYEVFDDCSVVTAPYSLESNITGVLGVIGPTRMAYERIIPIVDITAKVLGAALNSRN